MVRIQDVIEEIKIGELNVLKCRDDHEPILFKRSSEIPEFNLIPESKCSWIKSDESFDHSKLRKQIEPWLTALAQSDHFSLLVGSGLSQAVHRISTVSDEKPNGVGMPGMGKVEWETFNSQIESASKESAKLAGRDVPNIEDQIRVVNELLKGLQHYCPHSAKFRGSIKLKDQIKRLTREKVSILEKFSSEILKAENNIMTANEKRRDNAFGLLTNFLMSFGSRSGTRDRLQIFTTNYDRLIETGAEIAGLHLLDRFVGNLFPIFRSTRLNIDMHYNPPGIRGEPRYLEGVAHFVKLHGSLDWIYSGNEIRRLGLPFGATSIEPYLTSNGLNKTGADSLIIYPNEAKDRETTEYPYVELFRDFAASVCRPNHTLVTYGYGFGDDHINRMIADMLTIPSTHLVIISYSDPLGRIMKLYENVSRPAQTTLLIGNNLGNLSTLVDYYLPKPAIDRTTFKMAELLKARFATQHSQKDDEEPNTGGGV
jgi:hypothetical protein